MVDTCHYAAIKTHRMYTKTDPDVYYGLQSVIMCHYQLIMCNKRPTPMEHVNNRELQAEARFMGALSTLYLIFL